MSTLIKKRYAKALAESKRAEVDLKRAKTIASRKRQRLEYYRKKGNELGIDERSLPKVRLPNRAGVEHSRAHDPAFRKGRPCVHCGKQLYVSDTEVHATASKDEACAYAKSIVQGAKP